MKNQSLEYQAKNNVMEKLIKLTEKYPDKDWNWGYVETISKNPNLTIEMINKYPDKDWYWWEISCHENITMEIIEKYPDKPWDWKGISCNQNLTCLAQHELAYQILLLPYVH